MKNKKLNKKITSIATTALLCLSLSSNTFAAMEFSTAVSDADKGKLNGTLILGSYKFPISTSLGDYTLASTSTGQAGVKPIIYQYNRYKNGGSWVDYETGEAPVIPIPEKIIITHERLKNGEPFKEAGAALPWSNSITIPTTAYTKGMYSNGILKIGLITYDVSNADAKAKFAQLESEASTKTNFFSVSGGVVIIESSGSGGGSLTDEQINQLKGTLQGLINSAQRLLDENPEAGLSDIKKNKRKTVEDKKTAAENFLKGEITIDGLLTNLQDLSTAINAFYNDTPTEEKFVTGIKMSKSVTEINQGSEFKFEAEVTGGKDADTSVAWDVYKQGYTESVTGVTIGTDGLLKVLESVAKDTKLTVKATTNGLDKDGKKLSVTADVTVKDKTNIAVESVTLSETSKTVNVGDKFTLTATVKPDDATNKAVKWSTSKASVATVNETTGEVEAIAEGTATITATSSNGIKASCTVSVTKATVPGKVTATISNLDKVTIDLKDTDKTATVDLTGKVTVKPIGAATDIKLTVNDTSVADAVYSDNKITVTGKATGNTTIKVDVVEKGKTEVLATTNLTVEVKDTTPVTTKTEYTGSVTKVDLNENNTAIELTSVAEAVYGSVYSSVYNEVYNGKSNTSLTFKVEMNKGFEAGDNSFSVLKVNGNNVVENASSKVTKENNVTFKVYTYKLKDNETFNKDSFTVTIGLKAKDPNKNETNYKQLEFTIGNFVEVTNNTNN